jgi:hypothetical protein
MIDHDHGVGIALDQILGLHAYFAGTLTRGTTATDFRSATDFLDRKKWTAGRRIRFSSGWGTLLTNDFRGCDPGGNSGFDPISLICKVSDVDGRPTVKLSDNYAKALGPASEGKLVYFMSVDNARFRRPVFPGDVLHVHVMKQRHRANVWKFEGRAEVRGQLMAEAVFAAMIMSD